MNKGIYNNKRRDVKVTTNEVWDKKAAMFLDKLLRDLPSGSAEPPTSDELMEIIRPALEAWLATLPEVNPEGAVEEYLDNMVNNTVDIDITTVSLNACSLGNNSKWYNVGAKTTYHRAFPVQPGEVYEFTATNGNGQGTMYGLLTSSYTPPYNNNDSVPYITGGARITVDDGNTEVITIPEGCAYLVVNDRDGAGQKYYTLKKRISNAAANQTFILKSEFTNLANKVGVGHKVRVCAWNIGCFHNGDGGTSSIPRSEYEDYSLTYRNFLNDINADLLCMSEFNPNFVEASGSYEAIPSRSTIFAKYPYAEIGTKSGQLCEALMTNSRIYNFNCINFTKGGRYYAVGTIYIGTIPVKLVSIHLSYHPTDDLTKRTDQISELVRDFGALDHVIICGDTNVASYSELEPFVNAGFSLVNCGYLGQLVTYENEPGATPVFQTYLDNIIVKGFAISEVKVYGINKSDVFPDTASEDDYTLSDHHPIAATLTLL